MELPPGKVMPERGLQLAQQRYCPWAVVDYASYPNDAPLTPIRNPFIPDARNYLQGWSPLTVLADLPTIMFGDGNLVETRPANPKRQLEWTTPVRDELHKIERRLESLDLRTSNEEGSRQAMTELVQAVQVLTRQIPAFAETSVDRPIAQDTH